MKGLEISFKRKEALKKKGTRNEVYRNTELPASAKVSLAQKPIPFIPVNC